MMSMAGLPVYAAPGNCNTPGVSTDQTSVLISATDDIIKPQGMFATNSPFAYGWVFFWDDSIVSTVFYDGTAHSSTVSARVVGSNDTGDFDWNTVDLNPNMPGVQRDVYVFNHFQYEFLRYVYDPVTDIVTVSSESPVGFDRSAFYGQIYEFEDEYYGAHGNNYPLDEDYVLFFTDLFSGKDSDVLVVELNNDDEAVELLALTYKYDDWLADFNKIGNINRVYEVRVPYTVQSADGNSATADIVLPRVFVEFPPA